MTIIILAGLVGTSAMLFVMSLIHYQKLANANMPLAIGTIFLKDEHRAYWLGLLIHYCAGIFFASLYALLWGVAPVHTPEATLIFITFAGLVHGLVVSILLIVEVAEHHPVKRFQTAGVPVALSHVVGHIVYGLGVGAVFSMMSIHLAHFLNGILGGVQ